MFGFMGCAGLGARMHREYVHVASSPSRIGLLDGGFARTHCRVFWPDIMPDVLRGSKAHNWTYRPIDRGYWRYAAVFVRKRAWEM